MRDDDEEIFESFPQVRGRVGFWKGKKESVA